MCKSQIHIRPYLVINCSQILINTLPLVLIITLSGSEVFLIYFMKFKPYIYVFNFQKRFLVIIWFAFFNGQPGDAKGFHTPMFLKIIKWAGRDNINTVYTYSVGSTSTQFHNIHSNYRCSL